MKTASATAASLVLSACLVTTPLQAQSVNLAKTSCKEFLSSGKEGISIIWAWLYGYYSDQNADPIVDFNKLIAKGQALAQACAKTPDKDIISVAEDIYEK